MRKFFMATFKNIDFSEKLKVNLDDPVKPYLDSIASIPLLSEEEELKLGKLAKYGTAEEKKYAKNELVTHNLRFVIRFAQKYTMYTKVLSFLDLIQEGNLGLMIAAEKYDVDMGFRFTTYAGNWIIQKIRRAIVNQDRAVRFPVHVFEQYSVIQKAQNDRIIRGLPPFTKEELKRKYHLTDEFADAVQYMGLSEASLDTKVPSAEDESCTFASIIQDTKTDIEQQMIDKDRSEQLDNILNTCLSDREREVIYYRFGLHGYTRKTLSEIGPILGVTRERIRQIEGNALRKIKSSRNLKCIADYAE